MVKQTKTQEPKEQNTLVDEAYRKLKAMIFRQNLISGQRLIAKDLADIFKMSRTPIINALYQLEREGFIVSAPFRGFYVKPVDIEEARDLFEVREALEVLAIELAVDRHDQRELEELEHIANKHRDYMPHYYDRRKIALGSDFHVQIGKMTKNEVLARQLILNLEHVYLRFSMEGANPTRMQPAVDEHYQLIEYIRNKNKPSCVSLVREHVCRSRDHIFETLNRRQAD